MDSPIILTVRYQSTRLPGKCLLPFSFINSNERVIDHNIKRLKKNNHRIIICTGIDKKNDCLEGVAEKNNIEIFRSHDNNKVIRWFNCLKFYKLEGAHFLDCDDPFFDLEEIKYSLHLMESKRISVRSSEKSETGNASVGNSITFEHLKLMFNKVKKFEYFEMIDDLWHLIDFNQWSRTESFDPLPSNTRITLDYFEDFIFLSLLKKSIGTHGSRSEIDNLLLDQKWLLEINREKNILWKKRQNLSLIDQRKMNEA